MRILFLPYYYYLQYESFKPVIKELISRGINAKMLYIPNISPKDETQIYNILKFKQDGIPFVEFRLSRFPFKNTIFRPLSQILQFTWNSRRLKNLLKKLQPDGIVIGSHLGGIYVRLIQIFCYKMRIPIISMWVIEVSKNSKIISKWLPLPCAIKSVLRWEPHNQYTRNHLFLVTGSVLKEHLIKKGIKKEQIVVTGNPAHDEMYINLGNREEETILKNLELKKEEKYVVFLTEVIHEIFGISYFKNLINTLKFAFDKLPLDIKIVIKFHPRETDETKKLFKEKLSGKRYLFLENVNLFLLLRGAELSIGHFTKALETSFLAGTPVLSINFSGDESYSLYKDKIMECRTSQEFEKKILLFFSDNSYQVRAKELIKNYIKENAYAIDGNSTQRVAQVILRHINILKVKEK